MHTDSAAGTFRRGPLSDGPCGRAGHPRSGAAPTSPPQRARAGRPALRGDVLAVAVAGRAEIGTWLRVRGPSGASGVPPWLTGVGRLLAISLAPLRTWWLSRRRAECAGRGRRGWKPSGDRAGGRETGWAELRRGREAPGLGGRGAREAETVPSQRRPPNLPAPWSPGFAGGGGGGAHWLLGC